MFSATESSSPKPSYAIRFRTTVKHLSSKHAFSDNKPQKKRNYNESFGERDYEVERYGQEIDATFFENHIGHGVIL